MNILTTACFALGFAVIALLIVIYRQDKRADDKAEREARKERYRRFQLAQADIQLMRDVCDETFDFAARYGVIRRYPDDFKEAQ